METNQTMVQDELNTETNQTTNEFDDYDELSQLSQKYISDYNNDYESDESEYDWTDDGYESENNWIESNNMNYV